MWKGTSWILREDSEPSDVFGVAGIQLNNRSLPRSSLGMDYSDVDANYGDGITHPLWLYCYPVRKIVLFDSSNSASEYKASVLRCSTGLGHSRTSPRLSPPQKGRTEQHQKTPATNVTQRQTKCHHRPMQTPADLAAIQLLICPFQTRTSVNPRAGNGLHGELAAGSRTWFTCAATPGTHTGVDRQ